MRPTKEQVEQVVGHLRRLGVAVAINPVESLSACVVHISDGQEGGYFFLDKAAEALAGCDDASDVWGCLRRAETD